MSPEHAFHDKSDKDYILPYVACLRGQAPQLLLEIVAAKDGYHHIMLAHHATQSDVWDICRC